ncbi:MAG: hypothetical protein A2X80_02060 [Geobacteraceae bacterium GWB2_52_12]|nr:MAG: hypothetical protein A2X80_02060 [Geobacteraceae bacterium GWB2_52_12]
MQDSASFWTDIKELEEQLTKAPDSFCFARLSAVYLKAGLVDDALHAARRGVAMHPGYLSGQRALSMACHAKGLNNECIAALKRITQAIPEDVASQKLLGRLLVEAGEPESASRAFRVALEFDPDEVECRIQLEHLERSAGESGFAFEGEGDEEIIEDLEIIEEEQLVKGGLPEAVPVQEAAYDPLSTVTLAELYVKQGFPHKALEIYRTILADNPLDRSIAERVAELETSAAVPAESVVNFEDSFEEEAEEAAEFSMPPGVLSQEAAPEYKPEAPSAFERPQSFADVSAFEHRNPVLPSQGKTELVVAALERWLENIRRFKLCR